ncbi:MAG: EAL domain-containing protein, partial [Gammaproteobacteria bacterium]|nr:EAL domain-containing protein [Gammaproteobacteria bacterium]
IDTLKIDRSFVTPLREGDDVMVRSIIRLGRELGINIIAEGVEVQEEIDQLLALGCNQMQGYFYARPMSFADLCEWLAQHYPSQTSQYTVSDTQESSD